ncbi:TerB family tellurite resistance protein [Helicobacter kayseriensis]|uniref:TerB family tellurite resistance protein n=1 Tax=Helicobacter kayseriensis TaxID=2905877 RepID=UPI001E5C3BB3|nr:TerB family tellurite resistance protein [Helicobacter kayseriensis]MCE3046804.1 TerB family tellurite resistance protein [Helicobacter kayseriensis]MCE3047894.1 TerB family tellurite resistance protein [Helicobacter kayseriensis]
MFEMIIILGALGVLYYLYITLREYLGNENNQKRFMKQEEAFQLAIPEPISLEEKIYSNEFGLLAGILGYVANADGEICVLEKEVASSMLEDMARELEKLGSFDEVKRTLEDIFYADNKDIQKLTRDFCELTKGEYRKKLKVVEFCFVLGYADGILNEATKEAIIDVGALLELDNKDFNDLYTDFAKANFVEVSLQEAQELFGDAKKEELHQRYLDLIAQTKQNPIGDEETRALNGRDQLLQLRKIHQAYEILKTQQPKSE